MARRLTKIILTPSKHDFDKSNRRKILNTNNEFAILMKPRIYYKNGFNFALKKNYKFFQRQYETSHFIKKQITGNQKCFFPLLNSFVGC